MRRASLALIALISLGLGACGGGGSSKASDATTTTDAAETTTTVAAEPVTQQIGKEAWFAGYQLSFPRATFTPSPSPLVEIEAVFENLGADASTFDGLLVLAQGGNGVTSTDLTGIPEVPGGTKGSGTMRFNMAPGFVFDDAILTIGSTEHTQAVVPLGSEGELVSLEPVAVTVTGKVTAGQLQLTAHGAELRADTLEDHGQTDAGQRALTINFDVLNSGTGGGGYPLVDDNFALTLPDGTSVAPDDYPIELLGHQATTKDLSARFTVDDPAAGDYFLLLREGETEGKLKFTIEGAGEAATTTT